MDKLVQSYIEKNHGKYEYLSNLSNEVYLLKKTRSDEKFVLKTLLRKEKYIGSVEMFEKRFKDLVSSGENIILKPEEVGTINKQYYKLYKYHEVTLRDLIRQYILTAKEAVHLFENILETMQLLHNIKIYHGNLKPSNIFYAKDGRLLLADFAFESEPQDSHYLIPNAAQCPPAAQDIYALGVIFYELLSWDSAQNGIFHQIHIPGNLYLITEKACLHPDKKFFSDADDMHEFLRRAVKPQLEVEKKKDIQESMKEIETKQIKIKEKTRTFLLYLMLYTLAGLIILYLYLKQ